MKRLTQDAVDHRVISVWVSGRIVLLVSLVGFLTRFLPFFLEPYLPLSALPSLSHSSYLLNCSSPLHPSSLLLPFLHFSFLPHSFTISSLHFLLHQFFPLTFFSSSFPSESFFSLSTQQSFSSPNTEPCQTATPDLNTTGMTLFNNCSDKTLHILKTLHLIDFIHGR